MNNNDDDHNKQLPTQQEHRQRIKQSILAPTMTSFIHPSLLSPTDPSTSPTPSPSLLSHVLSMITKLHDQVAQQGSTIADQSRLISFHEAELKKIADEKHHRHFLAVDLPFSGRPEDFATWHALIIALLCSHGYGDVILKKVVGIGHRTNTATSDYDHPLGGCSEKEIHEIMDNLEAWEATRLRSIQGYNYILKSVTGECADRIRRIPMDNCHGAWEALKGMYHRDGSDPNSVGEQVHRYQSIKQLPLESAEEYGERHFDQIAIMNSMGRSISPVEQQVRIIDGLNPGYIEVVHTTKLDSDHRTAEQIIKRLTAHEYATKREGRRDPVAGTPAEDDNNKRSTSQVADDTNLLATSSSKRRTRREEVSKKKEKNRIDRESARKKSMKQIFYLDSGATSHSVNNASALSFATTSLGSTIKTVNNQTINNPLIGSIGISAMNGQSIRLDRVLYHPSLTRNILSSSSLEDQLKVTIRTGNGIVTIVSKEGAVLFTGVREGGLYRIEVTTSTVRHRTKSTETKKPSVDTTLMSSAKAGEAKSASSSGRKRDRAEEERKKEKGDDNDEKKRKKGKVASVPPFASPDPVSDIDDSDSDEQLDKILKAHRSADVQQHRGRMSRTHQTRMTGDPVMSAGVTDKLWVGPQRHLHSYWMGGWSNAEQDPVRRDYGELSPEDAMKIRTIAAKIRDDNTIQYNREKGKAGDDMRAAYRAFNDREAVKEEDVNDKATMDNRKKELAELKAEARRLKGVLRELVADRNDLQDAVRRSQLLVSTITAARCNTHWSAQLVNTIEEPPAPVEKESKKSKKKKKNKEKEDENEDEKEKEKESKDPPGIKLNLESRPKVTKWGVPGGSRDLITMHDLKAYCTAREIREDEKDRTMARPENRIECESLVHYQQGEYCIKHNSNINGVQIMNMVTNEFALVATCTFKSVDNVLADKIKDRYEQRLTTSEKIRIRRALRDHKEELRASKTRLEQMEIEKKMQKSGVLIMRASGYVKTAEDKALDEEFKKNNKHEYETAIMYITGDIFAYRTASTGTVRSDKDDNIEIDSNNKSIDAKKCPKHPHKDSYENRIQSVKMLSGNNNVGYDETDEPTHSRFNHYVNEFTVAGSASIKNASGRYNLFISAKRQDSSIGRLITHSYKPNCKVIGILTQWNEPMLKIVPARNIAIGELLTINMSAAYKINQQWAEDGDYRVIDTREYISTRIAPPVQDFTGWPDEYYPSKKAMAGEFNELRGGTIKAMTMEEETSTMATIGPKSNRTTTSIGDENDMDEEYEQLSDTDGEGEGKEEEDDEDDEYEAEDEEDLSEETRALTRDNRRRRKEREEIERRQTLSDDDEDVEVRGKKGVAKKEKGASSSSSSSSSSTTAAKKEKSAASSSSSSSSTAGTTTTTKAITLGEYDSGSGSSEPRPNIPDYDTKFAKMEETIEAGMSRMRIRYESEVGPRRKGSPRSTEAEMVEEASYYRRMRRVINRFLEYEHDYNATKELAERGLSRPGGMVFRTPRREWIRRVITSWTGEQDPFDPEWKRRMDMLIGFEIEIHDRMIQERKEISALLMQQPKVKQENTNMQE